MSHPDGGPRRLAGSVLSAVRDRGGWTGEGALQNQKTGAPLRVDCDAFVIPSRETGQPLCLAAVMHDVTERERAREQRERLEVRTLFTSGHPSDVMSRHGLLESGLQFIAKPYTPHTLAAKVRAVLDAGQ